MPEKKELEKEYNELIKELGNPELVLQPKKMADISQKLKELEGEISSLNKTETLEKRREEAERIIREEKDADLKALAEEELKNIEKESQKNISGPKKAERQSVILEIRAGTGGDEAALFAADLARMYQRFAERMNWKIYLLDEALNELGGIKSVTLSVEGRGAYEMLKNEAGVHRVQRVPKTEKSGRIHTSAAAVIVLPKPEKGEMNIPQNELRIDTMRAHGPGGQLVNRRESAVRVLHTPTGIMATSQTARTQNANREYAMQILLAKLAERKREEEATKAGAARKAQVATGDRSEKIRTYNFPQDRVTDHRINESWHNLEKILDGDIANIIETLKQKVS